MHKDRRSTVGKAGGKKKDPRYVMTMRYCKIVGNINSMHMRQSRIYANEYAIMNYDGLANLKNNLSQLLKSS